MATRSFDPASAGARLLAETWIPQRERWVIKRALVVRQDGTPLEYETVEVSAPDGQQLVADGAEFISRRVISPHDKT